MTLDIRDVLMGVSLLIAAASMILVSRNARRATAVQRQNTDLTRIRDLRNELRETKDELDVVREQATLLNRQLVEANGAATAAYRERAEMLRYARMPGVTLEDWISRFDAPPAINGRIDG